MFSSFFKLFYKFTTTITWILSPSLHVWFSSLKMLNTVLYRKACKLCMFILWSLAVLCLFQALMQSFEKLMELNNSKYFLGFLGIALSSDTLMITQQNGKQSLKKFLQVSSASEVSLFVQMELLVWGDGQRGSTVEYIVHIECTCICKTISVQYLT